MEEMNCSASMKAVATKLPYKLRERWRQMVCDIQEQQNIKVNFKDLDGFIRRQSKIAMHPIFGDIRDGQPIKSGPWVHAETKIQDWRSKKTFKTSARHIDHTFEDITEDGEQRMQSVPSDTVTTNPCMGLDSCNGLRGKTHKYKIEFLRGNRTGKQTCRQYGQQFGFCSH